MSATTSFAPEPVLVGTKLRVPSVRPGFVARPAHVERLTGQRAQRLTLVCAPAGWGKTTLLCEWHAAPAERRAFAWLSLDWADDDPVRFWRYVIGALRTVSPDLGSAAEAALPGAGPDLADVVVAPLINELAALRTPLVLVLDDYHVIHTDAIHDSIAFLLRHLPASAHLAIASRSEPPLPLPALRAAADVTEIRAADLRFSSSEAEALLNGSLGLDLDAVDVELLRDRTEGWAAGLQLAALSARGVDDRHGFAVAFAGDDRQIGDYLQEVLADQTPELREFLLCTSILERMCASLCDAVTGLHDAAAQLEAVERANLFLVPLDTRRSWFRYHHLFGELLRHELVAAAPEIVPALHRRASAWHRAHGNVDEAIAHATAAGDFRDAADLIAEHWRPVWSQGQTQTVKRWIEALPREAVLADARLCLARGWAVLYVDSDECDRWRRVAEEAPLPGPFHDGTRSLEEGAAILRAAHANLSGDVGGALEAARRALDHNRDETAPSRMVASTHLGMAAYYAGDLDAARAAFEDTLHAPLADEWPSVGLVALGNLAAIYADLGELERGKETLARTERAIEAFRAHETPFACRSWIARGKLLEADGDLPAAEASFERAVTLARRANTQLVHAHALLALAMVRRRRRAHGEARTAVRDARRVLADCRDPGMVGELLAKAERALQLAPAPRGSGGPPGDPDLSERELAVLRLLATDLSQREIASELFVSFNTVKSHVRSLFRKLGVAGRADAVSRARELGLV